METARSTDSGFGSVPSIPPRTDLLKRQIRSPLELCERPSSSSIGAASGDVPALPPGATYLPGMNNGMNNGDLITMLPPGVQLQRPVQPMQPGLHIAQA